MGLAVTLLLAIPEFAAAQVRVLDSNLTAKTLLAPSALPGCNGIIAPNDRELFVVHSGAGRITRIDLETMKASVFVPPAAGVFIPDDITSDPDGNLYVTGTTPFVGEVYRIDREGRKTVIARGLAAPNGIAFNPKSGRLFISECFWGDRLYEIDPTGAREPRLLVEDKLLKDPEGFGIDADGKLIVPELGAGRLVKVDPDSGAISPIAEGLVTPVGLDVGPDGKFYLAELATGAVYRLDADGKGKQKLAQLTTGLDNLALTPKGRLFVTSFHDATVYEVSTDGSGKFQRLFPDGINIPSGIAATANGLMIADAILIRSIDGKGGSQKTKLNAWLAPGMPLPLSVAEGPSGTVYWSDWINGAVASGNPATGEFKVLAHLKTPIAVAPSNGRLFVPLFTEGKIVSIDTATNAATTIANGLDRPIAIAVKETTLFVAEAGAGRISRLDTATGKREVFISGGLGRPAALALDGGKNLLIIDSVGRRLLRTPLDRPSLSVVAENLPVDQLTVGTASPLEFPASLAVAASGEINIAGTDGSVIALSGTK